MNLMVRTNIQSATVWELMSQKHGVRRMKVPNWQHHSKKDAKRKLKPQALRSARDRRRHLINCLQTRPSRRVSSYYRFIQEKTNASSARNQVTTSKAACY